MMAWVEGTGCVVEFGWALRLRNLLQGSKHREAVGSPSTLVSPHLWWKKRNSEGARGGGGGAGGGGMVGIAAMELVGWRGAYLGKRGSRSRHLRVRRLLLLLGAICLSPVLLPLVCLSSPIICALALCFRFGRGHSGAARGDEFARRCEEGEAGAPRGEGRLLLLHQYLEDQMGLVGAVVRDCCGGVDDDGDAREGC